jgi:hypothetical protein
MGSFKAITARKLMKPTVPSEIADNDLLKKMTKKQSINGSSMAR